MLLSLLLSLILPAVQAAPPTASLLNRFALNELRMENRASGRVVELTGGTFVVPVYKELEGGNLWRLLASMTDQTHIYSRAIPLEAVIVVNNLNGVTGVAENELTVRFLNQIARKEFPAELEKSPYAPLIQQVLKSKLRLHILDETSGRAQTIGEIRDIGTRFAVSLIPPRERSRRFIGHMDGDCRMGNDYLETVSLYLENPLLDFVLLDWTFELDPSAEAQLYQTWAFDNLNFAAQHTLHVLTGQLPRGPTPRIVVRASVMEQVGVPHKAYGEDGALTRLLKQSYTGAHAFESTVRTGYRGRPDGFDARWILENKDRDLSVSNSVWHIMNFVLDGEDELRQRDPLVARLCEQEYQRILANYQGRSERLRESLARVIESPQLFSDEKSRFHGLGSALLHAPWLPARLERAHRQGTRASGILADLEREFPFQLEFPVPLEMEAAARMDAFRRARLLNERRARNKKPLPRCEDQIAAAHSEDRGLLVQSFRQP